jgi:hypothetical protein
MWLDLVGHRYLGSAHEQLPHRREERIMQEFVPLISGFAVGLALSAVRPSWRWWLGAVLAVAFGVAATVVTGEFATSWAFVLIDIPLVAAASACGSLVGRRGVRRTPHTR